MRSIGGWKVANIRGVDLRIHPSLLFLLAYVILVASVQFPAVLVQSGIDRSMVAGGPLAWGLVFALALFGSVVLHEFGHVLVAQSLGVKVQSVTLMMLGGVSEMERIPESRYAEFKVSVVGPLVSFAIAAALFALREVTRSENIALFSYWVARANLVLGIFNLLPALPLDGGRALRSILAARQGMSSATFSSVRIAKGFAWILGLLGLFGFNFFLMLIAFFIYSAANAELAMAVSRGMLQGVRAGQVAHLVDPVGEDQVLGTAADRIVESHSRAIPVSTATGQPALLSIESLRREPRLRWSALRVRDVMERVPMALQSDTEISQVLPELAQAGALPLESDGRLIGVVEYRALAELVEFKSLDRKPEKEKPRRAA